MQVVYERCAAVDVGKDVIAVAVRLPGDGPDGRQIIKRTFKTFYGVLREAPGWLTALGVTHVAMEATGIYSMPVYHALIEHGDFARCWCATPRMSRTSRAAKPISPTRLAGALAGVRAAGGRFIPPADIKAARDVIRYRAKLVQSRTSEMQRLGNSWRTPGSRSTRWPPRSPPSPAGR